MELIRKDKNSIPFSLHDSKIIKMEIADDELVFYLDNVYEYREDSEECYAAVMRFLDVDLEECNIMVFDKQVGRGAFSGTRYGIKEFIDSCAGTEFEILTEAYGGYDTILEGLIWREDENLVSGIISIWTMGDVVFDVEEERFQNE